MTLLGPVPPKGFIDNGCGPKTVLGMLKYLVPDGIRLGLVGRKLDWKIACRFHDYHWKLAKEGKFTYAKADSFLYWNMRSCLLEQGATIRAAVYPTIYWAAVRLASIWKLRGWA
jgi:hypothetical protein